MGHIATANALHILETVGDSPICRNCMLSLNFSVYDLAQVLDAVSALDDATVSNLFHDIEGTMSMTVVIGKPDGGGMMGGPGIVISEE